MYKPRLFDVDDPSTLTAFMREQSFALLVTNVDGVPFATHVPLLLDGEAENGRLLGHLAKANGQWQGFDGETEALVMFWGPHAYISPNWYESEKMVPTWNYVTVHAYGKPKVLSEPAQAEDVLKRLTDTYENDATGNWSMDVLPEDFVEKQIKGIVAFEIPLDRVEGKFKLSQNRKREDRLGAIQGLRNSGDAEATEVARLMEDILPDDD
ncbi:MAG: FMN-binding negative transcriptional regulator [Rhodospirillales bacterium]|nr:FMN-binding negative transcriptional regulator [Alphaproteobacteria bacterium]MBL6947160.1 FMN-binding negative transcriptional regulator [Rhodospirillales bacterium]